MTMDETRHINSLVEQSRHYEHYYKELNKVKKYLKTADEDVYSRKICDMALETHDNNGSNYNVKIPKELYETIILMLINHFENMYNKVEKQILEYNPGAIKETEKNMAI